MNADAENKFPDDTDLEWRLTGALDRLPDAPLASNFTARVLQAVELAEKQTVRRPRWNWHFLFPRIAAAATVLIFAVIGFEYHQAGSQRTLLAKTVARVATAQPLPSVDALKNFDAIQRMGQPRADENLLALLQ